MSVQAYRRRLPLLVFILLALVCLGLLAFACVCMTEYPMQAIADALATIPLAPALIELWPVFVAVVVSFVAVTVSRRIPASARSPAALQRFLL